MLCSFSCLIFIMGQKLSPEKDRLYLQGRAQGQRQDPRGFPLRAPPPPSTTSSWLICPSANSVSSVSLFSTPSQFLTRQLGRNFSKSSPITLSVKIFGNLVAGSFQLKAPASTEEPTITVRERRRRCWEVFGAGPTGWSFVVLRFVGRTETICTR